MRPDLTPKSEYLRYQAQNTRITALNKLGEVLRDYWDQDLKIEAGRQMHHLRDSCQRGLVSGLGDYGRPSKWRSSARYWWPERIRLIERMSVAFWETRKISQIWEYTYILEILIYCHSLSLSVIFTHDKIAAKTSEQAYWIEKYWINERREVSRLADY